jgi:hypothetical protein
MAVKPIAITISFVGYVTQTYGIKNCNDQINISLDPDAEAMSHVEITHTPIPINPLISTCIYYQA